MSDKKTDEERLAGWNEILESDAAKQNPDHAAFKMVRRWRDELLKRLPEDKRPDEFLSDQGKKIKEKALRARSEEATREEIETLIKSKSHAVREALLSNPKLASAQISEIIADRVDLEKWGGESTHEWRCLMLVLRHSNTPAAFLEYLSTLNWPFWRPDTAELVFAHPNCTMEIMDDCLKAEWGGMRPALASSPYLTSSQARALLRHQTARDELERSSTRWKEGAHGGQSVRDRKLKVYDSILKIEKSCHVNLAKNEVVPIDVLREIEHDGDLTLIRALAVRFEGQERESLLEELERTAPSDPETNRTIAELSRDAAKLATLSLSDETEVLELVASNPATRDEDKVLISLRGVRSQRLTK